MEDPIDVVYSNLDKISTLIEQMHLAHATGDEMSFRVFHSSAGDLCFETMRYMEKEILDGEQSSV